MADRSPWSVGLPEVPVTVRRPKTLILDVYGRYAAQFRGWLPVANLVELMGLMGVEEQAVRSAVSRMTRRGLLAPEARGRVRGYVTTPLADELLADGDRRIYRSIEPARIEDGWVLLSFSMPESERDKRHVLRSRLMWLGMGNLSSGLWIAPSRLLPGVKGAVADLGLEAYVDVFSGPYVGPDDVGHLVARCWDLSRLAREYSEFLDAWSPVSRQWHHSAKPPSGEEAFPTYTLALHEWRKFPYLDPGLPAELLPARWPGRSALELFHRLRADLEPIAFDYARKVARQSGGR